MIDITPPDEFLEPRHWGGRCIGVTPHELAGLLCMKEFTSTSHYPRERTVLKWEVGSLFNARVVLTVLR